MKTLFKLSGTLLILLAALFFGAGYWFASQSFYGVSAPFLLAGIASVVMAVVMLEDGFEAPKHNKNPYQWQHKKTPNIQG